MFFSATKPIRCLSIILFSLPFCLAGCSAFSGYPTNYQDTSAVITVDQKYLSADVRTKGNSSSDSDREGLNQQQYRDTVVYSRIEVIDINYYDLESKLTGTYDALSLGSDLTVLVLNGLGATTGGSAAKAALAAASAGVVGANAAVNTDIFYKKTIPALISEMRAGRQTALVVIKTGLKNPVSVYSLDQALGDVNSYYIAGTLPSAVSQITAHAGATLNSANIQLEALRNVSYVPPASGSSAEQILYWLYPGGDENKPVNTDNLQKLSDWMKGDTIDPLLNSISVQTLLTGYKSDLGESDRQRAISKFKIPKVTK